MEAESPSSSAELWAEEGQSLLEGLGLPQSYSLTEEDQYVSWGMPSRNSSRFAGIGALVNPFLLGCSL